MDTLKPTIPPDQFEAVPVSQRRISASALSERGLIVHLQSSMCLIKGGVMSARKTLHLKRLTK